jgi:hypothetical protein
MTFYVLEFEHGLCDVFYVESCAWIYQSLWGGRLYAVSIPRTLGSSTDTVTE